ncbi:MAG: hypothetical protein ILP10_08550, partial [Lachnospiraceae bacterium]|nr:hypothetical protein [Lachnospiraceae bacterium]
GKLAYKLYVPKTATEANPAPAVLLLHGYQNDHETCAAYAIELAKRGVVVMALDEYGHGASTIGLINRGYVNQKVTVNFGNDSEAEGTFITGVGGPKRYRLMMNFSNLSFFDEHYTKDSEGNILLDSSCGGITAYAALAGLPCVDSKRMALSGHSMGTWSSFTVAAAYSGTEIEPKATVLQCGELFRDSAYDSENIKFNNVLLLQAKWDEFSYFRDYKKTVTDDLLKSDLRLEFLGCKADEAKWDTTYGNFADGSARRIELLYTNHRLTTHNTHGLATALEWFDNSIGIDEGAYGYDDFTALAKERLVLVSMLCVLIAMFPLMSMLLNTKFFSYVKQPLPPREGIKRGGKYWRALLITVLIAGLSFPFMTQLGHGLLPLPEGVFRMTIGNGFVSWYLLLIIVMIVTTFISKRGARKEGRTLTLYDMGLSGADSPNRFSFKLCARSALLVLCMTGMVYLVNLIYEMVFDLDLRFIWPFFKSFNLARFGQFGVYILIFAVFYLLNNSKIMAGMRTEALYKPGLRGFLGNWWRNFLAMAGGLILITLIEYIPFFLGIGPGADVLFGSTFGGPFMSLLILFVPQVLFFSFACTYCYRKTGSAFTGAFTAAVLACWIVTGGSAML